MGGSPVAGGNRAPPRSHRSGNGRAAEDPLRRLRNLDQVRDVDVLVDPVGHRLDHVEEGDLPEHARDALHADADGALGGLALGEALRDGGAYGAVDRRPVGPEGRTAGTASAPDYRTRLAAAK